MCRLTMIHGKNSLYRISMKKQFILRRNKKFECPVCNKVIIGEEQWKQHTRGRVHKRHVEGLKRKEANRKYLEKNSCFVLYNTLILVYDK